MSDLVEVLSVQVFNDKSEDGSITGGELYGAIVGNDYSGTTVFFKEKGRLSDDFILPDGTLSLTGPYRCNLGDSWDLGLKLYLKKNHNYLVLGDGYLKITPADSEMFNNKVMSGIVSGRDGYVVVNMIALTNAVQATVEVSLAEDVGRAFYGRIRAWNNRHKHKNLHEVKYFQSTLFSASQDKPVYTEGKKLPLTRFVTAVPIWRNLIIEARLFEQMNLIPVADGDASFVAQPSGEQTQIIGCVKIKVTWTEHC